MAFLSTKCDAENSTKACPVDVRIETSCPVPLNLSCRRGLRLYKGLSCSLVRIMECAEHRRTSSVMEHIGVYKTDLFEPATPPFAFGCEWGAAMPDKTQLVAALTCAY
ncbi:hypothetical protein CEXT_91171 [Caerostris extrusa]|uniref:Uncharacterized protein n=1 Tax=Caerostris extrusa TaxID=172846 RepID=A0AAV4SCG9_CAEEX|nr:hypothetical protein CEXT_91171 [Caerostris extrusa]